MAQGSRLAVLAALIGNLLIAVAKLVGGSISGSASMYAEAAHSFSDVGNQVLLLVGIKRADRPPSRRHPFGGAKSAYFWPLLVAVLLFGFAGGFSVFEGIEKFLHPHEVEDITVSLIVLGVAFAIEGTTLTVALLQVRKGRHGKERKGRKGLRAFLESNRDATLLTVLVEDGLALVGLPIAALAVLLSAWTGDGRWDGAGSIAIGLLLMSFALFLGREIHDLLLGRGLRAPDREAVLAAAEADPDVVSLQRIQSMHLGPERAFLGAEVVLRDDLDQAASLAALRRLEAAMVEAVPILTAVYLEPYADTA